MKFQLGTQCGHLSDHVETYVDKMCMREAREAKQNGFKQIK